MAEILRVALERSEESPIDDATRRLMLHLSIDQPPPAFEPVALTVANAEMPTVSAPPPSLLRRVFWRMGRQQGAVQGVASKGRGSDRK